MPHRISLIFPTTLNFFPMRHILFFLLILLALPLRAQSTGDSELDRLVGIAAMLRTSDAAVYSRALQMLQADTRWTPMDELGNLQPAECKPADKVTRFRLNRILSRADGSRKFVASRGDFLNGEDERFNYSLYERTLRAHQKATYRIKGREGHQTFVLLPHTTKGHGLTLQISASGATCRHSATLPNGALVYTLQGHIAKNQVISLTVSNTSGQSQSFVLLNHNPRK